MARSGKPQPVMTTHSIPDFAHTLSSTSLRKMHSFSTTRMNRDPAFVFGTRRYTASAGTGRGAPSAEEDDEDEDEDEEEPAPLARS